MASSRMPRLMRSDQIVPARLPQQSFAGHDAVIAATGNTAAALSQMSNWLASQANQYATIEGAEYGATHAPTAQQLADATPQLDDPNTPYLDESTAPTTPLKLPSSKYTTFGQAANTEYLTVVSGQLQAATVQDFSAMALAAEQDLSMTPDKFADALDSKLNNMAKVLDELDPSTALAFRATLGTQAAGLASTFNTRWLARERELMQSKHLLTQRPLIENLRALLVTKVDGDTTVTAQIDNQINTWLLTNAFYGATASSNKTHSEWFYQQLDEGAYQAMEEFFAIDEGQGAGMLHTPSLLIREVAGKQNVIDDPRLDGPVEYLMSRGVSSLDIVNELNKIITERIAYESTVETHRTNIEKKTFSGLQIDYLNALLRNDENKDADIAAAFEAMSKLEYVSGDVYAFREAVELGGERIPSIYAEHQMRIRRGIFDREGILGDFPNGLTATDVATLIGEVDTAETSRLGRALELAKTGTGANLLLQIKSKTSIIGRANIRYNAIASELRTQFEDALNEGIEFDAVASVQILLGETAEDDRRKMEADDKENADLAMEAVYTLASHLADDAGVIPLNQAIEWLKDLANKWSQLPRDDFAKKQFPDGFPQLQMQIVALTKRRNAGNE